jgi:hypothetical protein
MQLHSLQNDTRMVKDRFQRFVEVTKAFLIQHQSPSTAEEFYEDRFLYTLLYDSKICHAGAVLIILLKRQSKALGLPVESQ